MIANYLRVSAEELESYKNDPGKLDERLYADDIDEDENFLDIDKSWEGLFFLLTGNPLATYENVSAPLVWLLVLPQELNPDEDMGYGPATYTTAEQTKQLSNALQLISVEELGKKYNGKEMEEAGVYPDSWSEDETGFDYIKPYFVKLKAFYKKAAEAGQLMIFFIN